MSVKPVIQLSGSDGNAILATMNSVVPSDMPKDRYDIVKKCMEEYIQSLAQRAFDLGVEYGRTNPEKP